jgi:DNA-binding MarR family transcriptional regulator
MGRPRKGKAVSSIAGADYAPDDSIGFLMSACLRTMAPLATFCASSAGISFGTWYFLRILYEEDGLTQRELTERVGLAQPTAVVALRNLELTRMIRRETARDDKRKALIYLTSDGRTAVGRALPLFAKLNALALAGLSTKAQAGLRRSLKQIMANAVKLDQAALTGSARRARAA